MGLEGLDFGEQTYRALIEGIEIAASWATLCRPASTWEF